MLELSHKKLQVYQFALQLVKEIYLYTQAYPKEEQPEYYPHLTNIL